MFDIAPEAQPRHTPLGGLRRLGTVMNRRKSVVGPSAGTFDRKAEKKRSPFAAFKRADSSRDMQIPESPPGTASGRPDTSSADHSSFRNPSISQDHSQLDAAAVISEPRAEATTNGANHETQAGLLNNHANPVSYYSTGLLCHAVELRTNPNFSRRLTRKDSQSVPQPSMRSHVLKMRQLGMFSV